MKEDFTDSVQQLHSLIESSLDPQYRNSTVISDARKKTISAVISISSVLQHALEHSRKIINEVDAAEASKISVGEIVAYAQRISGTTSAPSYWRPGMPMVGFLPPAPLPEMMRMGSLAKLNARTVNITKQDIQQMHVSDFFESTPSLIVPSDIEGRKEKEVSKREREVEQKAVPKLKPAIPEKVEIKKPKIIVDLDDLESSSEELSSDDNTD